MVSQRPLPSTDFSSYRLPTGLKLLSRMPCVTSVGRCRLVGGGGSGLDSSKHLRRMYLSCVSVEKRSLIMNADHITSFILYLSFRKLEFTAYFGVKLGTGLKRSFGGAGHHYSGTPSLVLGAVSRVSLELLSHIALVYPSLYRVI